MSTPCRCANLRASCRASSRVAALSWTTPGTWRIVWRPPRLESGARTRSPFWGAVLAGSAESGGRRSRTFVVAMLLSLLYGSHVVARVNERAPKRIVVPPVIGHLLKASGNREQERISLRATPCALDILGDAPPSARRNGPDQGRVEWERHSHPASPYSAGRRGRGSCYWAYRGVS
jgi:hypothetical protein